jgi:hypothetical protein
MSLKHTAWKQPQHEKSDGYGKAPGQLEMRKPYGRHEPADHQMKVEMVPERVFGIFAYNVARTNFS